MRWRTQRRRSSRKRPPPAVTIYPTPSGDDTHRACDVDPAVPVEQALAVRIDVVGRLLDARLDSRGIPAEGRDQQRSSAGDVRRGHARPFRAYNESWRCGAHAQSQSRRERRINGLAAAGPDKSPAESGRRERRASRLVPSWCRHVDGRPEIAVERGCIDVRPRAGGGGQPGGVGHRSRGRDANHRRRVAEGLVDVAASLQAETTLVTPLPLAKLKTFWSSPTKRPFPALGNPPPRLMFTTSAPFCAA